MNTPKLRVAVDALLAICELPGPERRAKEIARGALRSLSDEPLSKAPVKVAVFSCDSEDPMENYTYLAEEPRG